ncbi:hypothetical protein G6O69_06325 [Pseudenhygromyxa sp. WMMC2535]|uniref:hypothetical protein n=1 Tax=Pseudenhygromyxa sp. WMMC2535 TaxID=2712867 RepID=UPI0015568C4B|nr:hypothetical protein [Pseudenhygromyxa sp. WMMC2535]NVB37440.1 hypothetical protein [Pseudenhygromyxa sp. WMMC2535]
MMVHRHLAISVFLAAACTSGDRAQPKASPVEVTEVEQPEEMPPKACNAAVPRPNTAIALAEEAKRAGGYPDQHEVDGPKAMVEEGFLLSPMVPTEWPPRNCTVVFYVSETRILQADSVHVMRSPVAARITVELDTGETSLTKIEDGPGFGGELAFGGGGPFAAKEQMWVFVAVTTSTESSPSPEELSRYKRWLEYEVYVAAALFRWHHEFFGLVAGADREFLERVEVKARPPRRQDHRPPG